MSLEHVLAHEDVVQADYGLRACPSCGFMMPGGLRFCWMCGRSMALRRRASRKKRGSKAPGERGSTRKKTGSREQRVRGAAAQRKVGSTPSKGNPAQRKRGSTVQAKGGSQPRGRHPSRSRA